MTIEEMDRNLDEWIEKQNKGWARAIELRLVRGQARPAFEEPAAADESA